jgi:hypothetical protein
MKTLRLAVAFVVLFATVPVYAGDQGVVTFAGGDGSTMDKAIIEQGVTTDEAATHAEYVYLARNFHQYHLNLQSLLNHGNKVYDLLEFTDASGVKRKVYFDITATFGKFQ